MDKIILKDYEVLACHGVNPEEKVQKQRFVFSCILSVDFDEAARSDDLNKTVSYAAVKKVIKAFCEQNCFDLLETLSSRLAVLLLKSFPLSDAVELTVKKPDAPMSGKFDYAGVNVIRKWHRVYLSLGSNIGDKNAYLDFALNSLKCDDNFKNVRESTRIVTQPYGGVASEQFVNSAVECYTVYSAKQLLEVIHGIEQAGGRVRNERWGNRTLDIDIIFFDNEIIDDKDLCVPHADMKNREFVLAPLNQINPNILHPIYNLRVSELYDNLKNGKI